MSVILRTIDCEVEGVKERQIIALAEGRDRIVGRVGVKSKGGPLAEMRQLFVIPEYRGRGIGKKLVRECIDQARHDGCMTLNLTVAKVNHEIIPWYRPQGFLPVYQFTDGEIVLTLPLKP